MEALANSLSGRKGQFYPYQADMLKEEDVLKAFTWVKDNVGVLHILVNNAGMGGLHLINDFKTEDVTNLIHLNVVSLLVATREALKIMNENNINGHIININSQVGHQVMDYPGIGVYTSSKFAVTALTKSMQNEIKNAKKSTKVTVSKTPILIPFVC